MLILRVSGYFLLSLWLTALAACGGAQNSQELEPEPALAPLAANLPATSYPDYAMSSEGSNITVSILANDENLDKTPYTIVIGTSPQQGSATLSGNTIVYTPDPGYSGPDSLTYQLVTDSGEISETTVDLFIACSTNCTNIYSLNWTASPAPALAGYYIYRGNLSGEYTEKAFVAGNTTIYDFGLTSAGTHFFAVTAVDSNGNESDYSNEINISL
jgi:hypothetical protein